MNKLFPLHTESTAPDSNRPYYLGNWEPILVPSISGYGLPSFQYKREATYEYFTISQTINGATTDITSKFINGSDASVTGWTAYGDTTLSNTGRNITNLTPNSYDVGAYGATSNKFTKTLGTIVNFRLNGTILNTGTGNVISVILKNNTTTLFSDVLHTGKNEVAYTCPSNSSDYTWSLNIQRANDTISSESITNATIETTTCLFTTHGDYVTYMNGLLYSALTNGISTFKVQSTKGFYSELCCVTDDIAFIAEHIKISVSSNVDYADIYYKGGFIQTLYRLANVRRSPQPKITVIGDERDGVVVNEKVITATRYSIKMKGSEALLDAFVTAMPANITVRDQTGKTFTMYNAEIEKPDWYNTNGIFTLSFDDNINVFTENSIDL